MGSYVAEEVLDEPLAAKDFSKPFLFNLKTNKPNKTIDIGNNGVSLSLDAQGRVWCSPRCENYQANNKRRCYKRACATLIMVSF